MLVARSRCGRWRVEIHSDQSARLWDGGMLLLRGPLSEVAAALAEHGVAGEDLVAG